VPLNVFLVEDSAPLRERMEKMLGAIPGARVVGHAAEAEEAIRAILATRPHVVVLDIKLAQGSGFDVMRALRDTAPQTEFYVLSNFASPGYRGTAERLGARGFFDKSHEFEALRDALAERARSHAE